MFEKLKKMVKDLYALEADATEEGVKKRGKLLKDLEKKLSKLREQLAEDELDAESRRKVQLELELSRLRKEKMFKNLDATEIGTTNLTTDNTKTIKTVPHKALIVCFIVFS